MRHASGVEMTAIICMSFRIWDIPSFCQLKGIRPVKSHAEKFLQRFYYGVWPTVDHRWSPGQIDLLNKKKQ